MLKYCLRFVFIIICENQPVVKYIDTVKENMDNQPLVLLVVWVTVFKLADPLDVIFSVVFWPFQFRL